MEKTTIKIGSSNGNNFAIEFSPFSRRYFDEETWQPSFEQAISEDIKETYDKP